MLVTAVFTPDVQKWLSLPTEHASVSFLSELYFASLETEGSSSILGAKKYRVC